jgi:hypothetical protein
VHKKGVSMSVAEICITAYLIVGAMATGLILTALKASKRHYNKTENVNYEQAEHHPLSEQNTKPSGSHR